MGGVGGQNVSNSQGGEGIFFPVYSREGGALFFSPIDSANPPPTHPLAINNERSLISVFCEIGDATEFGTGWDSNSQPSDLWVYH